MKEKTAHSGWKRILSTFLAGLMLASAMPLQSLAASVSVDEDTGQIWITDENGNRELVDETWETRFPYGTLAFGESQLVLTEGDTAEVTLTLHRLGGTEGRAEADLVFMPATAQLDDGEMTYVNAAGRYDYGVSLELPQPIAYYQPLGGSAGYVPAPVYVESDAARSVDDIVDPATRKVITYGEQHLYVPAEGSVIGNPAIEGTPVEADSYRWQIRDVSDASSGWQDISEDADQAYLVISNEVFYASDVWYDYRCIYTVDGVTYCSGSYNCEDYVPPVDDTPEIPEDFVNELNPGFVEVELSGDEFDAQLIEVVFAEGEETKEIVFTVRDDDLHEAEEFLLINILEARGAVLYDSANTITLRIDDDEEQLPSYVGFAASELTADKAYGRARITLFREGGIQYAASAVYQITDGTAVSGTDYVNVSGEAYFAPGMDETYIDIDLIQEGILIDPEDGLTATVTLTEVKGGGDSSVIEGRDQMTLVLYNTAGSVEDPNLATLLHSADAEDVSREVEVTQSSIVGGTSGSPRISAVSETADDLTGKIYTAKQARSFDFTSFDHGGTLIFSRDSSSYSDNYWTDWESIVEATGSSHADSTWHFSEMYSGIDIAAASMEDSTKHIDYEWNPLVFTGNDDEAQLGDDISYGSRKFQTVDSGQRILEHNGDVEGNVLSVPDAAKLYDEVFMLGYMSNLGVDQYDVGHELAVLPRAILKSSGDTVASIIWSGTDLIDNTYEKDGKMHVALDVLKYGKVFQDSSEFGMDDEDMILSMGLRRYSSRSYLRYTGNNNAYSTTCFNLAYLQFHRRYFEKDFQVLIHTANDADVASSVNREAAVLSDPNGYSYLFPTISLVQDGGGVTKDGKLYVGSKLRVAMGNSAAFDPASGEGDPVVFLTRNNTNGSSDVVAVGAPAKNSDGSSITENGKLVYYLTLMWDGMTEKDLSADYTVNVVMTRKQKIVVSYGTSLTNDSGTRSSAEAAAEFLGTEEKGYPQRVFNYGSAVYDVNYTNGTITDDYDEYFSVKEDYFSDRDAVVDTASHTVTYNTENIYWVNFGHDENDVILYNGIEYPGNATIWLSQKDLQNSTVSFVWYEEEYLTASAPMQPVIVRMERYLDLDGNGIVEGELDDENIFHVTDEDSDLFLGAFMENSTYEITELQPIQNPKDEDDPAYYQQIIKVYYQKTPRSLNPIPGSETNYAHTVPYITTGITNQSLLGTLSDPEITLRYLSTYESVPIYGGAAHNLAVVDVPLGGDMTPPYKAIVGSGEDRKMTWIWDETNGYTGGGIKGYLMSDFDETLSPIQIRESVLGSNVPVVSKGIETTGDGGYVIDSTAKKILNQYLGSLNADDTFGISIREVTDNGDGEYGSADDNPERFEASAASGLSTFPDANAVTAFSGAAGDASGDPGASGNPMSEFNIDTGVELPTFNFGLTDYVSIIMDGYEVGFSIGVPLMSTDTKFKKVKDASGNPTDDTKWSTESNPKSANADALSDLKEMFTGKGTPAHQYDKIKQKANEAKTAGHSLARSKNFSVDVGFNLTILFKYNPLDNGYYFSQASFLVSCGLGFTFTVRLTVCPVVFAYFSVGMEINAGASINADRVKSLGTKMEADINDSDFEFDAAVIADKGRDTISEVQVPDADNPTAYYYSGQVMFGPGGSVTASGLDFVQLSTGSAISFATRNKAFDIVFRGRLQVTAVDEDGEPLKGFTGGVITSDGSEAMTIKLAGEINGTFDEEYHVILRALPEKDTGDAIYSYIDTITPIRKIATNVTFGGLEVNPSMYVEIGAGVGVEVLKVEIFAKVSIAFAFAVAPQASGDTEGDVDTDPFRFTYFELAASLGIRAVLLFFDIEFEGIKLSITYDWADRIKQEAGWAFTVYLGGQKMYSADLRSAGIEAEELTVTVRPPVDLSGTQTLYSPADNASGRQTRAIDPTDDQVPFQLSGYGSSGDAFRLAEGLQNGGDFRLASVERTNAQGDTETETYIAFILSRADAVNAIDSTQLVLSRIRNSDSANAYGLVHPITGADAGYLVIDDNPGGDLSFDVYAENETLRFVWTTYASESMASEESAQEQAAAAAKTVVVKTAVVDLNENADHCVGQVTTLTSSAVFGNSYRFIPIASDDVIFFAETVHFTEEETAERNTEYDAAYNKLYTEAIHETTVTVTDENGYPVTEKVLYTQEDPSGYYMNTQSRMMDAVYGKTSSLNFAVPDSSGKYHVFTYTASDWAAKNVRLEAAEMTKIGDDYYLAYVTSIDDIVEDGEDTDAYRSQYDEDGNIVYEKTTTASQSRTIRQLYLQKITVSFLDNGETAVEAGKAALLRSLVDYRDNSLLSDGSAAGQSLDGLYTDSGLNKSYEDPYITNLRFLNGKLGSLTGTEEDFGTAIEFTQNPLSRDADASVTVAAESFLLFEMNGETYVIPQTSLESITAEEVEQRKGYIIPFFGASAVISENDTELNKQNAQVSAEGIGTNIGVDGNGVVTAVYTKSVKGTSNNALYMTKYDAASRTWGVGTMLAMNNMDVHEKAQTEHWTLEETEAAYYDEKSLGSLDSFTFHELDIAFGAKDELVVVTRGTLTEMARNTMYAAVYKTDSDGAYADEDRDGRADIDRITAALNEDGTELKVVEPKRNADGSLASNTGMYVISYGVGQQVIASPSISFLDYDLSAGAELLPTLSFINGGDTAVRAGSSDDGESSHPITLELLLGRITADDENRDLISETVTLAEWKIMDTIRAGAEVIADDVVFAMPVMDAGEDYVIYFRVSEDPSYFGSSAFEANTLTFDADGKITESSACIPVNDRPELMFPDLNVSVVGADDSTDTATVRLDAFAANLGTADADQVYLKIEAYRGEDASGIDVFESIDLTGHNLDVSLQREARDGSYSLRDGYLLLSNEKDSPDTAGVISAGMGRDITGTFEIPRYLFEGEANSVDLRFTLIIRGDEGQEAEFTYTNNTVSKILAPRTFFSVPEEIAMTLGSEMRLPMGLVSSTALDSVITVTDITVDEILDTAVSDSVRLGVLYYDAGSDALVVRASGEGSGVIRISDVTTNTSVDLFYRISGMGEGINFYNDNEIFDWSTEYNDWIFTTRSGAWESDPTGTKSPLRGDVAIGAKDATVSFSTYAESITLYFEGKIGIEYNYPESKYVVLESSAGGEGVTVNFGVNTLNVPHTVTILVLRDDTILDCYTEEFNENFSVETISDENAPNLYWSRSFPENASIAEGESVILDLFVVDSSGIASVEATLNGNALPLVQGEIGGTLWTVPVEFESNGTFSLTASDMSGNLTTTTFTVNWFNEAEGAVTGDDSAVLTLTVTDSEDELLDADNRLEEGELPVLHAELTQPDNSSCIDTVTVLYRFEETDTAQGFEALDPQPGLDLSDGTDQCEIGAGIWMTEVISHYDTDGDGIADESTYVREIIEVSGDVYPVGLPQVSFRLADDPDSSPDNRSVRVTVDAAADSDDYTTTIRRVVLKNADDPAFEYEYIISDVQRRSYTGTSDDLTAPGRYYIVAENSAGRIYDSSAYDQYIRIENAAVSVDAGRVVVIQATETRETGSITLPVTGGYKYAYEYALLRMTENSEPFGGFADSDFTETFIGEPGEDGYAPLRLDGLEPGTYLIQIRDAYDSGNASEVITCVIHKLEITYPDPDELENGSIIVEPVVDPGEESVDEGCRVVITVLPDDEYIIDVLEVTDHDGNTVPLTFNEEDGTYEFVMPPMPVEITVSFIEDPFKDIDISDDMEFGTVSADRERAEKDALVTLTISPDDGYELDSITVTTVEGDSVQVTRVNDRTYTFIMPFEDVTVNAVFKEKESIIFPRLFRMSVSAEAGGSITPEGDLLIAYGASRTFRITPDEGYEIEDILVNGVSVGAHTQYTIRAVTKDVEIKAVFRKAD